MNIIALFNKLKGTNLVSNPISDLKELLIELMFKLVLIYGVVIALLIPTINFLTHEDYALLSINNV